MAITEPLSSKMPIYLKPYADIPEVLGMWFKGGGKIISRFLYIFFSLRRTQISL